MERFPPHGPAQIGGGGATLWQALHTPASPWSNDDIDVQVGDQLRGAALTHGPPSPVRPRMGISKRPNTVRSRRRVSYSHNQRNVIAYNTDTYAKKFKRIRRFDVISGGISENWLAMKGRKSR